MYTCNSSSSLDLFEFTLVLMAAAIALGEVTVHREVSQPSACVAIFHRLSRSMAWLIQSRILDLQHSFRLPDASFSIL